MLVYVTHRVLIHLGTPLIRFIHYNLLRGLNTLLGERYFSMNLNEKVFNKSYKYSYVTSYTIFA